MVDVRQIQANALKKFLYTSCTVTPTVWIETFLPAAVLAVVSVLTPDPKEVVRIAGNGKSWLKQVRDSFHDAAADEPIESFKKTNFLFDLAEGIDRAVWWLFLAGVTADFLIEWSTLAYRMAGCTTSEREVTLELKFALGGVPGDNTWVDAGIWRVITPDTGELVGPVANIAPGAAVAICSSLHVKNSATNEELSFDQRWIDQSTGEVVLQNFIGGIDARAGNALIDMNMQVAGGEHGRTLILQVRCFGGIANTIHNSRITIYGGSLFGVRHRTIKHSPPVE